MAYRRMTSSKIFGRPEGRLVHDETSATREKNTLGGRLSPARGIMIGVTLSAAIWGLLIFLLS